MRRSVKLEKSPPQDPTPPSPFAAPPVGPRHFHLSLPHVAPTLSLPLNAEPTSSYSGASCLQWPLRRGKGEGADQVSPGCQTIG